MKGKIGFFCAAAVSIGTLAACSQLGTLGSVFGGGSQTVTGSYSLQTVNGNQLPYTFSQNGDSTTIQADYYTLNTDNTYVESTNETVSNGIRSSNVTQTERGNWSQSSNGIITFSPTYSSQGVTAAYSGTLGGGGVFGGGATLTISANGLQSVYSQQ